MGKGTGFQTRQQRLLETTSQSATVSDFTQLLNDDALKQIIEAHIAGYRERSYPPTVTLAMWIQQMLSVDKSCNNAVAQKNAQRLLNQDDTVSSNPSGFWRAKERLSLELVKD